MTMLYSTLTGLIVRMSKILSTTVYSKYIYEHMHHAAPLCCILMLNNLYSLGKPEEITLASYVLQFIFLGDNGFRFPIAQFPSGGCTPSDLFFIFWEGVKKMLQTGFV